MATDKCEFCNNNPAVTVVGITRNFNLCATHIAPPYDLTLIRNIINEMKTDTVVSFLKTIHDRIEQEEKIREVEYRISELVKHTKLDSVNALTEERDEGLQRIKKLEAQVESQRNELVEKENELRKTTGLKQAIDKLHMQLSGEIVSQAGQIMASISSESANIVSQLKSELTPVDMVGMRKQQHQPNRRRKPENVDEQSEPGGADTEEPDPETEIVAENEQ